MTLDLSLYLVTDTAQSGGVGRAIVDTVEEAVDGGVTAVQLRAKDADAREMLQLAAALSSRLPDRVALIVNDRVDVCAAARSRGIRVDGIHLGQSDLPPEDARAILGPGTVIGLSASTAEQIAEAEASPARIDYLGLGAVRATASKPDAPAPIGVAGLARLAMRSALPAVAIGGITPADLPALRDGGLAGAAVVSWVCAAPDPRDAAAELARAWAAAP
ncbi:MAG: thiamine phosphate synthase [Microbacterium sp.]